ncbi:acetolactate synthase 2 small subunit [Mergibacter septicus]|uniref:Acetolactate synthase 2 small subunit n=1 Tax=Mergibacter septicus TaxID=221402 RepID=A0A8E3MGB2_9PAST|nr:acetolactate synthase 2 small subunit [Mergibacter septicus]AWX13588.1 acetolactate synthase 2 small subunit [Mergibacter septicus]AWX15532.1 acetolactate synthase 2 small subunit [Mergibacter septicus]QDJ14786.1 acetolactate synthase 2 small subunit [Mergibacter septicus]UTU47784.1 acetolactate synthase 2 small subunit [Mergibacter septicus]WMR96607.1 acetolactate synthase 2 small subunit [Mergibacter septicus]
MQNYQIKVQAQWRPETLERILRVVRHRGFVVEQLQMQRHNQQIELTMSVSSERAISLLTAQLIKLYNVTNVIVE